MQSQRTIVSAYFDLGREKWKHFARPLNEYVENFKKNMTIDENMVLFIEPNMVDFVTEHRKGLEHKTKIIITNLDYLPKYQIRKRIAAIQESPEFKNGLAFPSAPELWHPDYVIISWSKIDLVSRAIEDNYFDSTYFAWMDFGMPDFGQVKSFPKVFHEKIRVLCRRKPQPTDLNRVAMCKSHTNRFASGFITGSVNYWRSFITLAENEMDLCLDLGVVDCDQTMYSNVYLQYPALFELYYGDWTDIIHKY